MKPERFTETLDHAGVNPDAIRVSKWYRKTTLKGDVSHFSSFSRTSDTFVETNLTSERESLWKMMKRGSRCRSVICLLHCQDEFSNPRIKH